LNFTSAAVASLADLTVGGNEASNVFNLTTGITGDFTLQLGIDAAVSYITTNIGKVATSYNANQKVIIAVHDNQSTVNNALFLYSESGTTGIQSGELTLIGVLTGVTDLSSSVII